MAETAVALEERVARLEFAALEEKLEARFAAIDAKFAALEEKIDKRFGDLAQALTALERKVDTRFTASDEKFDRRFGSYMRWTLGVNVALWGSMLVAVFVRT